MANKTKKCKNCGAEIDSKAVVCPKCGAKCKKPFFLQPWLFVVLGLLVLIVIVGSASKNKSNTPGGADANASAAPADQTAVPGETAASQPVEAVTPKPAPVEKSEYVVGDEVMDGKLRLIYVRSGEYVSDNQFSQPKEGYKYISLTFAAINEGNSDEHISYFDFEAYADGYSAEQYYGSDNGLSATLSPGRSTVGDVIFEVPKDAEKIEVEYEVNVFTDKKIKFIYEGEKDSGYTVEANTARTDGALNVGDIYEDRSLRITYISCGEYESTNMFVQPREGYHFVSIELEFENLSSADRTISSVSFHCYADGRACDSTYIRDDDLSATISAGRKARGTVTFEVPDDAEVIEAEFDDSIWTTGHIVFTIK